MYGGAVLVENRLRRVLYSVRTKGGNVKSRGIYNNVERDRRLDLCYY